MGVIIVWDGTRPADGGTYVNGPGRLFGRPAPPDIATLRAHARGEHRRSKAGCRACDLRDRAGRP